MTAFDYGRRFREIEQNMIADAMKRWGTAPLAPAEQLAHAMLEAKAGASGDFDGKEQMRRTVLMAEWILARLSFHNLALVAKNDGLTDEQREQEYREWLHRKQPIGDAADRMGRANNG